LEDVEIAITTVGSHYAWCVFVYFLSQCVRSFVYQMSVYIYFVRNDTMEIVEFVKLHPIFDREKQ